MTPNARIAIGALAVSALAGCRGGGAPRTVVIPDGSSFRAVADSLASREIIRFPAMFRVYAKARGKDRRVRAGTYQFARGAGWGELLDALASGRGLMVRVAIPEGFAIARIAPTLAKALEVPEESVQVAVRDTALLRELHVPTPTLEGYLFPDTYFFTPGTSARSAVRTMTRRFQQVWKPEWDAQATAHGMTRHEAMALAAIIETEARVAAERPVISAVYHNRLKVGMKLQADPTVQYALGRHVERVLYKDLEVDSKYNTYKYAGLPPGPIASPGAASMAAATAPADVPYLYFVAHPDGHHEFRTTFREHTRAIREVRALRPRSANGQ